MNDLELFKAQCGVVDTMFSDPVLEGMERKMSDIGIPNLEPDGDKMSIGGFRADAERYCDLRDMSATVMDGICRLESMMLSIESMKMKLVNMLTRIRLAYSPKGNGDVIRRLIDHSTPPDDVPGLVARLLGWDKIPGSMVGVYVDRMYCEGTLCIEFYISGAGGRTAKMFIPVEINSVDDKDINYRTATHILDSMSDLSISLSVQTEYRESYKDCRSMEELSAAVKKLIGVED